MLRNFPKYPLKRNSFSNTTDPNRALDPSMIVDIEVAINEGNVTQIRDIINDKKIALNIRDGDGNSPIHYALATENTNLTEYSRLEIINLLYDNGCPIAGNFNKQNITPLHLAVILQSKKIVKYLIEHGADINKKDNAGLTPLQYAVQGKTVECKKEKKPKSIFKIKSINDDTTKLIELINFIFMREDAFNKYFTHIKYVLSIFDKMFIEKFLQLRKKFNEDITSIAMQTSINDNQKKLNYKSRIHQLKYQIEDYIKRELNSSLSETQIGFYEDGWSPTDNTPKIIKNIDFFKDLDDFDTKTTILTKDINYSMTEIYDNINQMNLDFKETEHLIQKILMHNINFFHNEGIVYNNWLNGIYYEEETIRLKQNMSIHLNSSPTHTYLTTVPEINNFKEIYTNDIFNVVPLVPTLPSALDYVVRGSKKTVNNWISRGLPIEPLPLSYDMGKDIHQNYYPMELVGINEHQVISKLHKFTTNILNTGYLNIQDLMMYFNHHAFKDGDFTLVSDIRYHVIRCSQLIECIIKNIEVALRIISEDIDDKKIFTIIIKLIPSINNDIINCVNHFCIINKISVSKIDQFKKNKTNFETLMQEYGTHAYSYSLEWCIDYITQCIDTIQAAKNRIDTMYQHIQNVNNYINKIIELVNKHSAKVQIIAFNNSFTSNDVNKITNINIFKILPLKQYPLNISEYSKIIGFDLHNITKDTVLKNIQENLLVHISPVNPITFIDDIDYKSRSKGLLTYIGANPNNQFMYEYFKVLSNLVNVDPHTGVIEHIIMPLFNPLRKYEDTAISGVLTDDDVITDRLDYDGHGLNSDIELTNDINNTNIINPVNQFKKGFMGLKKSIDIQKADPLYPSIEALMDEHISIIKYRILKNIIGVFSDTEYQGDIALDDASTVLSINESKTRIYAIKTEINVKIKNMFNNTADHNKVFYNILAKTTDNIINEFINNKIEEASATITNKIVNNSIKINKDYILSEDYPFSPPVIQVLRVKEDGFAINMYNLQDSISEFLISEYQQHVTNNLDSTLIAANNLVENKIDTPSNLFQNLSINYSSHTRLDNTNCIKIDPDLVTYLIEHGADINSKDRQKLVALRYIINTLNPQLVNVLLENGAKVSTNSVKDVNGLTPLDYVFSTIKQRDIKPKNFYEESLKSINKNLTGNPDFKNNLIKHIETAFGQVFYMLNHHLFLLSKRYIGGWAYEDYQKLCILLSNNRVVEYSCSEKVFPLIELSLDTMEKILNNSITSSPLTEKKQELEIYKKEIEGVIDTYNKRIENLNKERDNLETDDNDKNLLDKQINRIHIKINEKNTELTNIEAKIQKLKQNLEKNKNTNSLTTAIDEFKKDLNLDKKITDIYKDIFTKILNNVNYSNAYNSNMYKGTENYKGYNILWETFLESNKIKSIHNIIFILSDLEKKMSEGPRNLFEEFKLISKLYSTTISPFARDYIDLPQDELLENYALKIVVDIITHSVRHVIATSLYTSIIKATASYILTVTPKESFSEVHRTDHIKNMIKNLFETDGNFVPELANYVVGYLPKIVTRYLLNVKNDNNDEVDDIQDLNQLLERIIDILIGNNSFSIGKDSELINSIKTKIFPFYSEILTLTVPKLKISIDNFMRYIVNKNKELVISCALIEKSQQEI